MRTATKLAIIDAIRGAIPTARNIQVNDAGDFMFSSTDRVRPINVATFIGLETNDQAKLVREPFEVGHLQFVGKVAA